MRIPKHVSGLLISLCGPANSLFVRDKYITPTGKRLHAGYVQKSCGSRVTYYIHIITILTPQFTFNSNVLWSKRNLYIKHFDTSDADLSFILGSNN